LPASLGVSVAILKEDSVLLILRGDVPVWCLPGGTVEADESIAEAAIREVREETGLDVRLTRLVGIYFRLQAAGGNHQALFTAEICGGEAKPDGFESLKVEWFPYNNLPERLLSMHRLSIRDALHSESAIVRSMNIYPTISRLTRQELYTLRDQGKLDLQAVLAELCAPIEESNIQDGLQ
jgi:ADP-ribose pyrophosphatase YjhB (NUDIX family)